MKAHRGEHTYMKADTYDSTHMTLRSPNAHGQVTRAILCGLDRKKAAHYSAHLDQTPGHFTLTGTPSVLPHCFTVWGIIPTEDSAHSKI